jgi:nucleoside phosphorylase
MRVLVVHDRLQVQDEIIQVFDGLSMEGLFVDKASDCSDARKQLRKHIYDLLVIDLTIPQISNIGGAPDYTNVRDLLAELLVSDELNMPGDIIGITRELEAADLLSGSIGQHVMVTIEEDSEGEWKKKLDEKFKYVLRAAISRQACSNSNHDFDCIIVTALDEEMAPFLAEYDTFERPEMLGLKAFSFTDKAQVSRRGLLFAVGRAGSIPTASYTQSLLSLFKPKLILLTGICAGLGSPESMKLGHIVAASSALDWDFGKWRESDDANDKKFASRPAPVEILQKTSIKLREIIGTDVLKEIGVVQELKNITEGRISNFEFHLAPMACGSAVVASTSMRSQISNLNDSIRGIDMESYGFFFAASKSHVIDPEFMCLKAVVDFADGNKDDQFHRAGCQASAFLARLIIERLWSF